MTHSKLASILVFGTLFAATFAVGGYFEHRKAQPVIKVVLSEPVPPSKIGPQTRINLHRAVMYRATLDQVARDYGIEGRLDCRVVKR